MIADNLRRLRTERNISQEQLADMVTVGQSTISSIECGTRTPSMRLLLRLADALDVPVAEILTEHPPEPA